MTKAESKEQMHKYIAPEFQGKIMAELAGLEKEHDIRILFAIESGSRAWGFPSPDSDYDVRFVYLRPLDSYLTLNPPRDVVELPIDDLLDINGWDIKKALGLMLKSNPVLLEWLQSPIRYMWNEAACSDLMALVQKTAYGQSCLHHYLSLGQRQRRVYIEGKSAVNLKKYFYVVRPAMAIRWLRLNPDIMPPMNFHDLKDGIGLPDDLTSELDILLEKKSRSKELGQAEPIKLIDQFLDAEFAWAEEAVKECHKERPDLTTEADDLFRKLINEE